MTRFEGKVCLVTGAGGDIGAATALRLAREGGRLVLFDRKVELLENTAAAIAEAGAEEAHCLGVDQTSREAVDAAVAEVVERHGGIDVLFANAGYGQFGAFLEVTDRQWHRHVDVNLTGTFNVCQEVARAMVARREGGSIVLNASSGAVLHADLLGTYCTTKAAVRMLAIGMAAELGAHRIRVNTVMPGVVETAMTAPMLADDRHRQVLLADTPVGRLGEAEDVAALVAFLASGEAGYITGESVLIDGGQVLHGHPRWFRTDYRQAHESHWEIGR
jgi:NAD(P)-dependent dehydrogenase (short-subunit alcohol dehydrogenase family)